MRFKITHVDPVTEEEIEVIKEFFDSPVEIKLKKNYYGKLKAVREQITALEWAEDWAYGAADKGRSTIKPLEYPQCKS